MPFFTRYIADTSTEAWIGIQDQINDMQQRIIEQIIMNNGLTCDEIVVNTKIPTQTVTARLNELCKKGIIYYDHERRKTRSGRNARVYKSIIERRN